MPELDPFEARLAGAVQAIADRARTRVDAADLARRVARGRRRGAARSWLRSQLPVPAVLVVAALIATAVFAWTLGTGSWWGNPAPAVTPIPTPTAVPANPDPSALAPAHVAGTTVLSIQSPGSTALVGGVEQVRGAIVATTDATNDPRADGTGSYLINVDGSSMLGIAWGTLRVENAAGAWEGTCTGGTWDALPDGRFDCWLTGSGAYRGLTYYRSARHTAAGGEVSGVIAALAPPEP